MADSQATQLALGDVAARQLANATKTAPQMSTITPRWLTHLLHWVPVEAGIYRLNKVKDARGVKVAVRRAATSASCRRPSSTTTRTRASTCSAPSPRSLDIHTRVSDLYSSPHDQIKRAAAPDHRDDQGAPGERADQQQGVRPARQRGRRAADQDPLTGAPTPDDLDELITRVWKEPAFFLAHPAGHRRVRPRMHAPRRAAADGQPVRLAVHHLARPAARPVATRSPVDDGKTKHPAAAHRREAPGRRRPVPAGPARRAEPGPVGALHGHQPQGDRLVPGLAVLLARRADRRRARRARGRGGRQVP